MSGSVFCAFVIDFWVGFKPFVEANTVQNGFKIRLKHLWIFRSLLARLDMILAYEIVQKSHQMSTSPNLQHLDFAGSVLQKRGYGTLLCSQNSVQTHVRKTYKKVVVCVVWL